MSEPCTHCKQLVAVPLRDIADRPVCGVCALQRLALIPRVLAALIPVFESLSRKAQK